MNFAQLEKLFAAIREAEGLDRFVVMGSLAVLGLAPSRPIPDAMLVSNEVDAYPEDDPRRGEELAREFGQGSRFEQSNGYYFDPISPTLPTLPDGWRERLIELTLPSKVRLKFLEPNDAAVAKYARSAPKDREWIREGLAHSILSAATIEYRLRSAPFLDRAEHERAKAALAEDRDWLMNQRRPRP